MNNKEFFNTISEFYDGMINFPTAMERRKLFFEKLKPKGKALDIGCGTGLDSIGLAKLGIEVTACDQSPAMIEKAKLNAAAANVSINFICSPLQSVFDNISGKFDFIISMGNTLANINEVQLSKFLVELKKIMNSNSTAIFQVINFDLLPQSGIFTINKSEDENKKIERYYEIDSDNILFKINYTNKLTGESNCLSTRIYPHTKHVWEKIVSVKDFEISYFGSTEMNEFNPVASKDLFIILKTIV